MTDKMKAEHLIITPNCQKMRGQDGVVDYVLDEMRKAIKGAIKGYGDKANYHVILEIERHKDE